MLDGCLDFFILHVQVGLGVDHLRDPLCVLNWHVLLGHTSYYVVYGRGHVLSPLLGVPDPRDLFGSLLWITDEAAD